MTPVKPTPPLRLTRAQVREVDRRSIEDYGIPGIVLMENAARAVVDVAMRMLAANDGKAAPQTIIVCGGGNNGGDGMAAARHLHNRGIAVTIALATDPHRLTGDAATQWRIVRAMGLPTIDATAVALRDALTHPTALVIDALFGTGLASPVRDVGLIDAINAAGHAVLAVDLPSGMDCDTGKPLGTCVRATQTVTFVAEKLGFANPASRAYTGHVTVGDIGCPREVIDAVG